MSIFGWIKDIFAIRKYKEEIKKLQFEIHDFEKKKSLVRQPSEKDLDKYNDKIKELEKKIETKRRTYKQAIRFWVPITALIVAIVGAFSPLLIKKPVVVVKPVVTDVGGGGESVKNNSLERQFKITSPSYGDSVGMNESIQGETRYVGMHHYVMVTPVKIGKDWIQEDAKVSPGGLWSGSAVFGTVAVGVGEKYVVCALATNSALSPGPLTEVPKDAIFSEPITVIRKQ